MDDSFLYEKDFENFIPGDENPTYILREDGKIIAAASIIVDDYHRRGGNGRFRIFHSERRDPQIYSILLEEIRKHTEGLDKVFLFVPFANAGGMIINVAAFLTGTSFCEPEAKHSREKIHTGTIKEHFITSVLIFKHNSAVRQVLVFYPVVTAFATTLYFYGQQHLYDIGLNKIQISFVMLISGVFASLGALSADKFSCIFGNKEKYIAASGLALFITIFGVQNEYTAIAAFLIQSYFGALLYPIASNALNILIPSEQRATIISVSSVMFSAAMILIFPICGFAGDLIGLGNVFYILGVVIIIFQFVFISRRKAKPGV